MKISGCTTVFTILAHPSQNVVAPLVFNRLFDELGLDMVYIAHDIPPRAIPATIAAFRQWDNLGGFNVTIPHKAAVRTFLDQVCPVTMRTGVVNTVVRTGNGSLAGYNTDGLGALGALGDVRGATCLMLGAGGAARAIIDALLQGGAESILLLNRSPQAAREVVASTRGVHLFTPDRLEEVDLVIQATPLKDSIPFDLELTRLKKGVRVLETVMSPTALSRAVEHLGLELIPGHAMLYHQTRRNFELLTGRALAQEVVDKAFTPVGYSRP